MSGQAQGHEQMKLSSGADGAAGPQLPSLKGLGVLFVALAIFWIPFAYYYVIPSSAANPTSPTRSGQSSSTFQLTLMEIMNTPWDSNTSQPRFFIMGPGGMTPASNISLPMNTPIQLTIIAYDTPTPGSTDQMGKVSGTVGGNVYLINGTSASGTDMMAKWGQNVTAVPGAMLAHTFTMPQLGINIPVVGGDTLVANLYLTQAGTFSWFCQTPCGSGPTGLEGAMLTSGWMTGQVTVH